MITSQSVTAGSAPAHSKFYFPRILNRIEILPALHPLTFKHSIVLTQGKVLSHHIIVILLYEIQCFYLLNPLQLISCRTYRSDFQV